jgi:SAM-dependent methyltransferase
VCNSRGKGSSQSAASAFDSLASDYDAWFDSEGKLVFAIEAEALRSVLPLLPEPGLEIGVGSGRFAQALGIQIGLDPSIELLRFAMGRGLNALQGIGESMPFHDKVFATAFLIVTLCFADSPLGVLREACRVLKEDGKVVLGVVLRESPWGQFYETRKAEGHRFYRHATFYSLSEVTALLGQAGFAPPTVFSTLFQQPGQVDELESLRDGYDAGAGFSIVVARRNV